MNSCLRVIAVALLVLLPGALLVLLRARENGSGVQLSAETPVQFARPLREPPITANPTFQHELSMADWANPEAEWYPLKEDVGPPEKAALHRRPFPGDVEFSIEPKLLDPNFFRLELSVSNERAPKRDGYVFRYGCDPDSGDGSPISSVELLRAGKIVARQVFFELPHQFSLRRCGHYIVGSVNARPILTCRDEQPLSGRHIAYFARGVEIPFEGIRIECLNVRDEYFSEAPVDWRTAGSAIAEVAARWQSDSRKTFFSLTNNRSLGQNAVLWNKQKFPGDVCMEMFVATRMQGERGQPYTYTRDFNVSLCNDGSDLTKGYTFLWGGFGNRYSAILRNGVEVARMEKTIPTDMNFTRHWFNYRIERRGNRLSFRVDRFFTNNRESTKAAEIVYVDPEPLPCSRLAIWTYDNALSISRVRIAGERRAGEDPGMPIKPPKFIIEEMEH